MANTTAEISKHPTARLSCAYQGWNASRCTRRRTPAFAATKLTANTRMNHQEMAMMPASLTALRSAIPNPTNPQRARVFDSTYWRCLANRSATS